MESTTPPYTLHLGDCLENMRAMPDNSVDAIVTDPPYELGFMGRAWDKSGIANNVEMWRHALRVLKPGGHLLAFGGTRTYHRMVCAIEDAGFEIRDQIGWAYGTGFPKSADFAGYRDDDGVRQTKPEFVGHPQADGWGTALKPAWEPVVVARKPLAGTVAANVLAHGTGALNIDGCRIPTDDNLNGGTYSGDLRDPGEQRCLENQNRRRGIGAFVQPTGRWPANITHDGSDEVLALFPQAKGQQGAVTGDEPSAKTLNAFGEFAGRSPSVPRGDGGSAARFFYCAKASRSDRGEGNGHPTVKPTELMRYLCRLVTPPGGVVLDPFMGSGSTGKAAILEGFRFIGCERESEYLEIARARIAHALASITPPPVAPKPQGDLFAA